MKWCVATFSGGSCALTAGEFDSDFILHAFGHTTELFSDEVKYLVLYGTSIDRGGGPDVASTPLPGALLLLTSTLIGGAGIRQWRSRRLKIRAAIKV